MMQSRPDDGASMPPSAFEQVKIAIMELDEYLEQNWLIVPSRINELWIKIEKSVEIASIGDFSNIAISDALLRMRMYGALEVNMRQGLSPLSIPIKDFYLLKCCDISLLRALRSCCSPKYRMLESDIHYWRLRDVCEEILDDIEDVRQDFYSFNCNRLIFSCKERGMNFAQKEYKALIRTMRMDLNSLWNCNTDTAVCAGRISGDLLYKIEQKLGHSILIVMQLLQQRA